MLCVECDSKRKENAVIMSTCSLDGIINRSVRAALLWQNGLYDGEA